MEPESSCTHSQEPPPVPILSQLNPVHDPPHPTSWTFILILSSNLRLDPFPSGFPTETLYAILLSPYVLPPFYVAEAKLWRPQI